VSEGIRTLNSTLEESGVTVNTTLTWWVPGESNTVLLGFDQTLVPVQLGTRIASDLYLGFCFSGRHLSMLATRLS
jgi:hypothetical protein